MEVRKVGCRGIVSICHGAAGRHAWWERRSARTARRRRRPGKSISRSTHCLYEKLEYQHQQWQKSTWTKRIQRLTMGCQYPPMPPPFAGRIFPIRYEGGCTRNEQVFENLSILQNFAVAFFDRRWRFLTNNLPISLIIFTLLPFLSLFTLKEDVLYHHGLWKQHRR